MASIFTKIFSKIYQKSRLDEASGEIDNLEIALDASSLVAITDLIPQIISLFNLLFLQNTDTYSN